MGEVVLLNIIYSTVNSVAINYKKMMLSIAIVLTDFHCLQN